ncbi:hypothetical protein AXF42_Ash014857 [Apostasia shenzhenica]|uniref:Uncharacterized protein n=1 Tax=Apostasia shenzhenica TaxID=1088818 RepID=A0A2I0ALD5_9ASPA|nr:hypothetical protein AXF42_Ash014857 [Apostasia shenzhenica]
MYISLRTPFIYFIYAKVRGARSSVRLFLLLYRHCRGRKAQQRLIKMQSACKNFLLSSPSSASLTSLPLDPSSHKLFSGKPFLSRRFPPKPFLSIRSSQKLSHSVPKLLNVNPLSSFLAAAAAAAALLFARFHSPPRALAAEASNPPPAAATESLSSDQELTEEQRERALEESLESNPDDVRSLRALMELKVKASKFQDAIAIVDRIIELDPSEKDLPLLKAHIQTYSGDTESARLGFEEILAQDPLLVEGYHGLVMTQREVEGELGEILKRVESAMETCKKQKRNEDVRDFKLLIAQIKVIETKYEEALKIYKELVKEEPRDFRPYLCQGIIYTLLRNQKEAEKQFEKYRRLVPRRHPYAQYFDDSMLAMKVFGQMHENRREESLKV